MAIITLKVSDANEMTRAPYWLIIDPLPVDKPSYLEVSQMVTGPFFSREDAQQYLNDNQHNYGDKAVVFCKSGYHCRQYDRACGAAGIGCSR